MTDTVSITVGECDCYWRAVRGTTTPLSSVRTQGSPHALSRRVCHHTCQRLHTLAVLINQYRIGRVLTSGVNAALLLPRPHHAARRRRCRQPHHTFLTCGVPPGSESVDPWPAPTRPTALVGVSHPDPPAPGRNTDRPDTGARRGSRGATDGTSVRPRSAPSSPRRRDAGAAIPGKQGCACPATAAHPSLPRRRRLGHVRRSGVSASRQQFLLHPCDGRSAGGAEPTFRAADPGWSAATSRAQARPGAYLSISAAGARVGRGGSLPAAG